jgi:menaquinone-9 beta-reductase
MTVKEVIVIGGGPAGLVTCFWLQKFGIPHVLLEKSTFPREKSCADNLTSNALRLINEINDQFIPEMVSLNILNPIYGIDLSVKGDNSARLNFNWLDNDKGTPSCYAVKRIDLDQFLMNKLNENPLTQIKQDTYVTSVSHSKDCCTIKTKAGELYHAKLVVVATGSNFNPIQEESASKPENTHNASGIRAYYTGVKQEANYCSWFVKKKLMPGGFYVSPLPNGQYNVNLVVRNDTRANKKLSLTKEFEQLIETDEMLKEKFKDAKRVSNFAGSQLILGTKKRQVCGDRFMITGDTAGLIDLITANGIPQAMLSGKLAAEQAKKCLTENNYSKEFIKTYEKTLFRAIKNELMLGRLVNPLLGFQVVNHLVVSIIGFITKNASENSSLIKFSYHKRPVLLLINPLFYFRVIKEALSNKK